LYINKDVSVALSDYHPKWKTVLKDVTTKLNAFLFNVYSDCCVKFLLRCKKFIAAKRDTGMHHVTTFQSTTNGIYDGGPVIL